LCVRRRIEQKREAIHGGPPQLFSPYPRLLLIRTVIVRIRTAIVRIWSWANRCRSYRAGRSDRAAYDGRRNVPRPKAGPVTVSVTVPVTVGGTVHPLLSVTVHPRTTELCPTSKCRPYRRMIPSPDAPAIRLRCLESRTNSLMSPHPSAAEQQLHHPRPNARGPAFDVLSLCSLCRRRCLASPGGIQTLGDVTVQSCKPS
jgi:hypothetical protein